MLQFSSLISKQNKACLLLQNHLDALYLSHATPNPVSGGKQVSALFVIATPFPVIASEARQSHPTP